LKKIPLRKCVITNTQHPKQEMFRVVRDNENNILVDHDGRTKGHGVYLVKDKAVITEAKKKHALDRHLEVKVPDTIYDELLSMLENE